MATMLNVATAKKGLEERFIQASIEIIGRGSFGHVYKVEDTAGKKSAVKVVLVHDEESKTYLQRELTAMKTVQHPNIVELRDHWVERVPDGDVTQFLVYFEMELCQISLADWLMKSPTAEKGRDYLIEILEGVKYLHEKNPGIIHRDLKPANILILEDSIKLCDLGLAKQQLRTSASHTLVGTPLYASPEVLSGDRHYTFSVDIYAIGLIALQLFYPPCQQYGLKRLLQDARMGMFPEGFRTSEFEQKREIVQKMLNVNPGDRPTAAEALEEVKGACGYRRTKRARRT